MILYVYIYDKNMYFYQLSGDGGHPTLIKIKKIIIISFQ